MKDEILALWRAFLMGIGGTFGYFVALWIRSQF